jgi:hypothetical protein
LTDFLKSTSLSFVLIELEQNQELGNLSCECMSSQFGCKPNTGTNLPKFWKSIGYSARLAHGELYAANPAASAAERP